MNSKIVKQDVAQVVERSSIHEVLAAAEREYAEAQADYRLWNSRVNTAQLELQRTVRRCEASGSRLDKLQRKLDAANDQAEAGGTAASANQKSL